MTVVPRRADDCSRDRLTVLELKVLHVRATCRGDSAEVYKVGYSLAGDKATRGASRPRRPSARLLTVAPCSTVSGAGRTAVGDSDLRIDGSAELGVGSRHGPLKLWGGAYASVSVARDVFLAVPIDGDRKRGLPSVRGPHGAVGPVERVGG